MNNKHWLALMIGNSRLHWAEFVGDHLQKRWDTEHLSSVEAIEGIFNRRDAEDTEKGELPLYLASVVPQQTALWQGYPGLREITLANIPLQGLYATLGIDRALAVWGAGETYDYPVLVIDAGTALTFTGVCGNKMLVGGAILPGVRSQFLTLNQKTAALPDVMLPLQLPSRWAGNTKEAIASGVIYTLLASIESFVKDWLSQFPNSKITLTGGDAVVLHRYLQALKSEISDSIIVDSNLIFWGMRSLIFNHFV
ncbi:MAG: pantothenate kinase [Chroococcales cyanobacterium]